MIHLRTYHKDFLVESAYKWVKQITSHVNGGHKNVKGDFIATWGIDHNVFGGFLETSGFFWFRIKDFWIQSRKFYFVSFIKFVTT